MALRLSASRIYTTVRSSPLECGSDPLTCFHQTEWAKVMSCPFWGLVTRGCASKGPPAERRGEAVLSLRGHQELNHGAAPGLTCTTPWWAVTQQRPGWCWDCSLKAGREQRAGFQTQRNWERRRGRGTLIKAHGTKQVLRRKRLPLWRVCVSQVVFPWVLTQLAVMEAELLKEPGMGKMPRRVLELKERLWNLLRPVTPQGEPSIFSKVSNGYSSMKGLALKSNALNSKHSLLFHNPVLPAAFGI